MADNDKYIAFEEGSDEVVAGGATREDVIEAIQNTAVPHEIYVRVGIVEFKPVFTQDKKVGQ